jgi:hypothetical protein
MGIRELHSLSSVVWAHQKTALTIRERSAGHTRATDCNVSTALPAVNPRFQLEDGEGGQQLLNRLDLHSFRDLVDPGVDRNDSLLERDVHMRAGPCGREVGPPMLMSDNCARPGAFGPSERTGIVSTSRKDCLRSNPKFEQRRAAFRADQVTEQQEVDDVAGPVVDRRRRVMRIGACMKLLCNLEPQCQRREGVRAGTRVEQ